jgi:cardiolipin synthase
MPFRRARVNLRRLLRRILRQDDPPERLARGVAAGFFAAAFPLPGLQIPLSLACAWLVRGNAAVAILPQFISNAGTMFPLAILQYHLGARLWPAHAPEAETAIAGLKDALGGWTWAHPCASLGGLFSSLGELGLEVLGPLLLGILVSGVVLAAFSYPVTVIAVWAWRSRRRKRLAGKDAAAPAPPFVLRVPEHPPENTPQVIARYALEAGQFIRADHIKLLVDGRAAYPEMLAAIAAAARSVDLETYILRSDRTGERFADALAAAAARGVRARLLYDDAGSLGLSSAFVQRLVAAGVQVAVYHPLLLSRPDWAMNRRDHRKILVVDGEVSFTGGLNLANEYAAVEDGGGGWRDTHLRLDGAAVAAELAALFEDVWRRAKPVQGIREIRGQTERIVCPRISSSRPSELPPPPVPRGRDSRTFGPVAVHVVSNQEFRLRRRIRRAYLHAIHHAEHYILIENAYFIPDRGIRRALYRAVARGVQVAVAVARYSDVEIAAKASRALYSELLSSGVRLFEWPAAMLHAKTAVIDDAWSLVGSYNLDHRSLIHNLEVVVVVADPAFARRLREQTVADIARCQELTLQKHAARPWHEILLDAAAYQVRYWL